MSEIEFDRASVGVSAKQDWLDSTEFAKIGNAIKEIGSAPVAQALPAGDNSGTSALIMGIAEYCKHMAWAALEYSDACAVLGSGQEEAIANYDLVETQSTESFANVRARLEGES